MKKYLIYTILLALISVFQVSAQNTVVPIVEMKIRGLLGGVQNGKWLTTEQMGSKLQKDSEFVLIGASGVGVGNRDEVEDVCQDFYRMKMGLKTNSGVTIGSDAKWKTDSGVAIGSSAKWNMMPRTPKEITASDATYKKVVADFLKTKGIAKPNVVIKQAYRIDLEGDGQEEVVLAATYYKNGLSAQPAVGDYSFVLVRKVSGKSAQNMLLTGDFVNKKVDFGAPNEHQISTIADLNGDGKMEIVVYGAYYEGEWTEMYEMKGSKPTKVLEIGCGV